MSEGLQLYRIGLQPPEEVGYKLVLAVNANQAVIIANLGQAPVSLSDKLTPWMELLQTQTVVEDHSMLDYASFSEKFIKERSDHT